MRLPNHLYHDTITIYPSPTVNRYGRKQHGTGTDVIGRFVYKTKLIELPDKESVQADALIQFKSVQTNVEVGQRVRYDSKNYEILQVKYAKDGKGNIRKIKAIIKRTI